MRVYLFPVTTIVLILFLWHISPPVSFPSGLLISIPEGAGLYTITEQLREEKIIKSPFWFRTASIILGGEHNMKAGQYQMSHPQNVLTIAWRILHGSYGIETVKITIPEGFTVEKITALFGKRFTSFDSKRFVNFAPEGYLFPDTYFIPITATASSSIKLLTDNFSRQIALNLPEIKKSGHTLEEIVTMASLLEAEAKTMKDRQIISGILWKRRLLKMPLQVDSEMNTYKFIDLPKEPINSPGLDAIDAAIHPVSTPYLYFLTADDGTMHYSKTFDEHVAKKFKYIKR